MDNSAYVPNTGHLNSPALVVFSQAAGGLQDALRIQRPFNPQFAMSEAQKELHRPFSASTFGLRHMEAYSGIPAHILNHLQPQFLHPGLSLGSGAFRPLADLKSFPAPSAFAPPKCLKIETTGDGIHSGHNHGIFSPTEERILGPSPRGTDSCSPASTSLSPQPNNTSVKEESLDAQMSEDGEHHSRTTDTDSPGIHEDNRGGFRIGPIFSGSFGTNGTYTFSVPGLPPAAHSLAKSGFLFDHDLMLSKKKRDPSSCPVCGLTISPGELESHFMQELERLYKLNGTGLAASRKRNIREPGRPPALPGDSGPEGRWETFQRIKTNRQGRLRLKIRKRKADDGCSICTGRPHRTPEELSLHVQQCTRKNLNDEDETVDVEGDSELEEWHESQRRRTSSLVSGHSNRSSRITEVDNEGDDVIVDGDEPEESTFGPSQYTESDVVMKESQEKDGVQSQVATVNSSGDVEVKHEPRNGQAHIGQQCDSNVSTSDAEPSSRLQLIEELKNRIKQLEAEGLANGERTTSDTPTPQPDEYKCLICLEHYKKPVISTVCWHVHCEECWLHTLGSKKVCPQCSMITSPTDLRRIFM
ncbi:E3 ubiquitin-protein ligase RNF220-like [Sitophilus oryzae]|uniref:E3 ubiquitin-protein ligase RNF220-like n=1 Tax=Sitophilus oryzae TaxID=7048 RepID=A0A6J2XCJ2_SITOR|nr:E3 ubiquitin-protein ligase RNF220-like [Sitophilus oryzae]XP_030748514.1 E3 ubiquitin-protein ligase RNF220-like [Sitophilus oryzae]